MMYVVGIKWRYTQPDPGRAYKEPDTSPGAWLMAGIGLLSFLFCEGKTAMRTVAHNLRGCKCS